MAAGLKRWVRKLPAVHLGDQGSSAFHPSIPSWAVFICEYVFLSRRESEEASGLFTVLLTRSAHASGE